METEVQIEMAEHESLESDCDWTKRNLPTTYTAAGILSPDEMIGVKWWLEEWYLEWKTLANIRNDTAFLIRSQMATNLKLGPDDLIKPLSLTSKVSLKRENNGCEEERTTPLSSKH